MLLLPVLIFFAVTFGLIGLFFWLTPTRTEQRLHAMAGSQEKTHWTESVVKVAGPLAKLSSPTGDWGKSPLRVKFLKLPRDVDCAPQCLSLAAQHGKQGSNNLNSCRPHDDHDDGWKYTDDQRKQHFCRHFGSKFFGAYLPLEA